MSTAAVFRMLLLAGTLAYVGVAAPTAHACSRPIDWPLPPSVAFERATAVFAGTVRDIRRENYRASARQDSPWTVVTFDVERSWKHVARGDVRVLTGTGLGDCGYEFKLGESYLVYASFRDNIDLARDVPDYLLYTWTTVGTKPLALAGDDLAFLGPGTPIALLVATATPLPEATPAPTRVPTPTATAAHVPIFRENASSRALLGLVLALPILLGLAFLVALALAARANQD